MPANSPTRLHCISMFMVVLAMLNVAVRPFQGLNDDGENLILSGDRSDPLLTGQQPAQFSSQSSAVFQTYLKIISKVISNISSRSYLLVLLCEAVKKNVKKMF